MQAHGAVVARAVIAGALLIPWLDERPVTASPHPPLAAPCRAGQLRVQVFLQGATGSLVGGIRLRNASTSACALVGHPRISIVGSASHLSRWRVERIPASPQPLDVIADPPGSLRALAPGKSAAVTIYWSNWCGARPDGFELALAAGTRLLVPFAGAPRCDAAQYPSKLEVAPFAPATRQLPPSSRLALAAAIVGPRPVAVKPGLRAFRARRGRTLDYRVSLTNTGRRPYRFRGSSCPTYIESLAPASPEAYVLNCRPVGAIAPGARVLFEMRIAVPANARHGNTGLTWQLAPKTYNAPFASAAVWVTR